MTLGRDDLLGDQHFLTNGAMLTLGQTRVYAISLNGLVDHLGVTQGGLYDCITNRAGLCIGTGSVRAGGVNTECRIIFNFKGNLNRPSIKLERILFVNNNVEDYISVKAFIDNKGNAVYQTFARRILHGIHVTRKNQRACFATDLILQLI